MFDADPHELLQVRDEHVETWELAANRLLGGLAQKILVPETHYNWRGFWRRRLVIGGSVAL